MVTDTLGFWDDYLGDYLFNPANSKTFTAWYRLPDEWLENGTLVPDRREHLLAHLYGANWRMGNDDGSKFVLLKLDEHELSDIEREQRLWTSTTHPCYAVRDDDTLEKVSQEAM